MDNFIKRQHGYRKNFVEFYGPFPHDCCFCEKPVLSWNEVAEKDFGQKPCVHHADGNEFNEALDNLGAAHWSCHSRHHRLGTKVSEEARQKISAARKSYGWPKSRSHINAVAAAHRGLKRGAKTRARLRAAWTPERKKAQSERSKKLWEQKRAVA